MGRKGCMKEVIAGKKKMEQPDSFLRRRKKS